MFELIKNRFSKYKILDVSGKRMEAIPTILQLAHRNLNYILYIEKEQTRSLINDPSSIKILVFNSDNYVAFRENYEINDTTIIRHIERNLLTNENCTICMGEKSSIDVFSCSHCNAPMCQTCMYSLLEHTVISKPENLTGPRSMNVQCPSCKILFTVNFN